MMEGERVERGNDQQWNLVGSRETVCIACGRLTFIKENQ